MYLVYIQTETQEGLVIVEEKLAKVGQNQPSAKILTWLLDKVLKLNNFTFKNHNFVQVKGTAMGPRAAPNYANMYMGWLEDRFVYCTQWYNHIIDWICFINDIWKGDSDSLNTFKEYLNSVVPFIKFTHKISSASVKFLYTKVMRDSNGNISTDVYHKPTDMHQYLHCMSGHPPHLKHSIPYSQALRFRRTCTSTRVSEQRIRVYSEYFVACGY